MSDLLSKVAEHLLTRAVEHIVDEVGHHYTKKCPFGTEHCAKCNKLVERSRYVGRCIKHAWLCVDCTTYDFPDIFRQRCPLCNRKIRWFVPE